MLSGYLLSIVIPTHNRSQYAYYSISSILQLNDSRIELVVSDTSTDNKLYQLLLNSSQKWLERATLKYFRPTEKLDMTGNHNFAISKATGEYVCLIGDDDTITDETVLATEWALNNHVEILAPEILTNYAWPDFRSFIFGSGHATRLYLPKRLGGIREVNGIHAFNSSIKNACQGTEGLPKIYHGIVKRSLIQRIIKQTGKMFHGSSPDVSGAIALSLYCKKFLIVDYPLTIPGASGGSNTGRSASNKHIGKLEDEEQTKSFVFDGWSLGVPRFFSVETVWSHAALETIRAINNDLIKKFNFYRLVAICKVKHPKYNKITISAIVEMSNLLDVNIEDVNREIKKNKLIVISALIRHFFNRAIRPPTVAGGRRYVSSIENIQEAKLVFAKYMKEKNWSWNKFISDNDLN
jgi:glycosyltransferase involved in cell wall biosynthesis